MKQKREKTYPIPRLFATLRKRAGFTGKEASFAIGKGKSYCAEIERGQNAMPLAVFRRCMLLFKPASLDILTCLKLNPFDTEIIAAFKAKCKSEGKDPDTVLQNLMKFYAAE